MRNISRILAILVVMLMSLTMISYAADFAHTFTITTDKTAYSAGDTVVVTVELAGTMPDVAMVQYSIQYNTGALSVDTAIDRANGYKCYDSDWYTNLKAYNGLGYINTPSCAENPTGQVNMVYLSTDGFCIDSSSDIYNATSTIAGKIKFTATANIDAIDSTYFTLLNAKVDDTNSKHSTVTVKQLSSPEPEEEVFEIKDTAAELAGNEKMKIKDETTGELKVVDATVAAGDKVVAIFSKDIEDGNDLAAESYGIIFGGKKYPGVAKVPDGYSWAVKLVGPASKLPAGNYTYGIFAAGQEDLNAGTYEVK